MKNTELLYFLESLQGQSLLDLSPAPGGGASRYILKANALQATRMI